MTLWLLIFGSTVSSIVIYTMRLFLWRKTVFCDCLSPVGRHAVITGANSGIGRATAIELAKRSWKLTFGCRNVNSANKVKEEIEALTGNHNICVNYLDLENPQSIEEFVKSLSLPVHVIINNAGVFPKILRPSMSFQGINVTLATNYIGHFYLTSMLLPHLRKSYQETSIYPRVINVSSSLSRKGSFTIDSLFKPLDMDCSKAYADSKLACNLFSRELHRRYGSGENKILDVYCLFTGGMVNTNLTRNTLMSYTPVIQWVLSGLMRLMLKSPMEGCQTSVHCAVSNAVPVKHANLSHSTITPASGSGMLYSNCIPIEWPDNSLDLDFACQLWNYTENFVKISSKSNM
ncbi:unnamed protein product [Trichobilharzia regenti]|uniref:Retinol dehydrogenase 12-like n=1 Tax=Trichobilharzia regenti TaxID=157069 RepID=A0A183WW34_TRIRE|nr:unnamed protein product [Trichobilharzia regenti]VDQ12217.1 unnamed protein product [Trichobilharzia regenti]